jgi:Uma2 family endonuclease
MSSGPLTEATLDDLYRVEVKAELIGGRIVPIVPTGRRPNLIAGRIYRSLAAHVEALGSGEVYTDNMGFAVPELSSGRQSFSPGVSYYLGPFPVDGMRFIEGPPTFAIEVRSEGDYGLAAEAEMEAKRADYFEAGTQLVWDVDPIARCVRVYRPGAPDRPESFHSGQEIDALPIILDWKVKVDWIFA